MVASVAEPKRLAWLERAVDGDVVKVAVARVDGRLEEDVAEVVDPSPCRCCRGGACAASRCTARRCDVGAAAHRTRRSWRRVCATGVRRPRAGAPAADRSDRPSPHSGGTGHGPVLHLAEKEVGKLLGQDALVALVGRMMASMSYRSVREAGFRRPTAKPYLGTRHCCTMVQICHCLACSDASDSKRLDVVAEREDKCLGRLTQTLYVGFGRRCSDA